MKKDKPGGGATGTGVTTDRGAQMKMTADGTHSKELAWKDAFIRFIVMTDQALSVSSKKPVTFDL